MSEKDKSFYDNDKSSTQGADYKHQPADEAYPADIPARDAGNDEQVKGGRYKKLEQLES